jgi:hypothetical protein
MIQKPVLAITLHQPWASLVAWELKHFETRSWPTPYRGQLIIHAGLNRDELKPIDEFLVWWKGRLVPDSMRGDFAAQVVEAMAARGISRSSELPMGCALCLADLVDCILMDEAFIARQSAQERLFGWWAPGRFAWQLENVRQFAVPVPARGAQQLWMWQGEIPA